VPNCTDFLLSAKMVSLNIRLALPGAAPARSVASTKSWQSGETRNGQHPYCLWALVPSTVTVALGAQFARQLVGLGVSIPFNCRSDTN